MDFGASFVASAVFIRVNHISRNEIEKINNEIVVRCVRSFSRRIRQAIKSLYCQPAELSSFSFIATKRNIVFVLIDFIQSTTFFVAFNFSCKFFSSRIRNKSVLCDRFGVNWLRHPHLVYKWSNLSKSNQKIIRKRLEATKTSERAENLWKCFTQYVLEMSELPAASDKPTNLHD